MDNKININKSQNNIVRVTSNNVQQLEKQAESYANSADKSRQDCANYLALVQRVLQECVSVKNEINVSYVSDLTDHVEDDNNPHKVTAEQVNSYTKSEVDDLLQNIDVTVDGVSASNLYVKDEVDDLLSLKSDKADVYTKTEIDNKHYLTKHQDISGKVDKVTGKGLSTEDYTTEEKNKLAGLSNYNDSAVLLALKKKADINHTHSEYLTEHQDISGKVDKVTGKGLSTEDYTTAEKTKLAGLSNYDDTEILSALSGKADVNHTHSQYLTEHQDISGKVDKVTGKGLSTEDYTTAEKNKLAGLSNYDDTQIIEALDGKADVNHTHSQYLTEHQDLSGKADISDIPTKTSDLTNDSGFLTSHQDISGKVDKVTGKGLSTNDYTTAEKNKLAGLSNYDDTEILSALDGKADVGDIPTKMSELENDNYYVSSYTEKNWTIGNHTTTTMGGDYFASNYLSLFDIESSNSTTSVVFSNGQLTCTFYNPIPIKVTKLVAIGNDDYESGTTKIDNKYVKGSNDGISWTNISFTGSLDTEEGVILDNNKFYKYYDVSLKSYYKNKTLNITATYIHQNTLSQVALSNDYRDLDYKPTIPDISGKVDKVTGKGLSTNDYTTAEKNKLAGLSNYDDTQIIEALDGKADVNHTHSQYLTQHQDISGKADINHTHSQYLTTHQDISGKVDKVTGKGLSTNDFTDSYKNKLDNLEENISIPTKTSDLTNDSGFLTSHQDISGKQDKSNLVTSLSASSTDTQYPSAKCVYNLVGNIETLLASI